MIGKKLGNRYEILEHLGGGGMAVVYKARDTFLDRVVTVKVLRSEYASDEAFVARFRREAQAVARLSHPNIVNIHDVGTEGDVHYLVMEYVDGKNLKTIIRNEAPLPLYQAVAIIRQVCDALRHAHTNNIVHRDVKPHNILITSDGRVKLTDFGIARETSAATITYADTVMGSVHYISPEQARGEPAGPRSDIYSLGIVAYEMLTGKLPFEGDTPIGVAMKHVQEEPPPLREINPSIPVALSSAIARALEKNPENRYQSPEEMARALEAAINGEGEETVILSRDDDMVTRVMKPVGKNHKNKLKQRQRYLWVGIPLVFVVLLAGTILALSRYLNTPDIKVPGVTGKPLEEARSILEDKGLKVEVASEVFSDKHEEGIVIKQSIGPGDPPVKPGRIIKLTVSKGPDLREVPNLTGMTEEEAMSTLLERGLHLAPDIEKEYNNKVKEGRIIAQAPSGGTFVKKGSEVKVTISLGPEPRLVIVPDVRGKKEEEAKAILANSSLAVENIIWENSIDVPYGRVVKQTPAPETEVKEGSRVQLVLSSGPGPGAREATVDVTDVIPDDGREHKVEIVVEDAEGLHTEYANTHVYGDRLIKTISYKGRAIIRIYVDKKLIVEEVAE